MENRDAFHLTAVDVRRYEFGTALRGYDRARVDQLREQVADELERLARVNQELEAKARGFHEQLRAFRERDKALNDALVSAQQLRGDMKVQAVAEADVIIRQARVDAERIVEEGRAQAAALRNEIERLDRARRTYLAQLRILAERHLAEATAAERQPPPVLDPAPNGSGNDAPATPRVSAPAPVAPAEPTP